MCDSFPSFFQWRPKIKRSGPEMLSRFLALIVLILIGTASASLANCSADAPVGLFRGTAGHGIDRIKITLNLVCQKDHYAGQFFTSQHEFESYSADGAAGHANLKFNTGAALGGAIFELVGDKLVGQLQVTEQQENVVFSRAGVPLPLNWLVPKLDLTPRQWREDLRVFANELPRLHANAFAFLTRRQFQARIAALNRQMEGLNGDEALVRLQQISNLIGDGHTGVVTPVDRYALPINIGRFGDDFRITAAATDLSELIGTRIETIDGMPISEAWGRALTVTPSEELDAFRAGKALSALTIGITLHGLDISNDRTMATFGVVDDAGRKFHATIHGVASVDPVALKQASASISLRRQHSNESFWCQSLPDKESLYCAFRAYPGLEANVAKMFNQIDEINPKKLIIDMRDNSGGDNTEGNRWLIQPIKKRKDLDTKGHLYILVGALTFSAAMNNAAQFQDETHAILVGQTIGERPNSYQEPQQFRLPNSHLTVRASTRYYEFRKHGENAVQPDKQINPSWEDVKSGRDPVLEWVLAQSAP